MKKNVSIKNQLVEKEEVIILNEGFWEKYNYPGSMKLLE
jgi:hypothetical protein